MSLAMGWYAVSARKWFRGPKINVEHLIHGGGAENGSGTGETEKAVVREEGRRVGENRSD